MKSMRSNFIKILALASLGLSGPLRAADADSDGLEDDWEQKYAAQLLALGYPSSHWGGLYSALLAGNIDPSHAYTGEDLTAESIHKLVTAGDTLFLEIQRRACSASLYDLEDYVTPSNSYFDEYFAHSTDDWSSVSATGDPPWEAAIVDRLMADGAPWFAQYVNSATEDRLSYNTFRTSVFTVGPAYSYYDHYVEGDATYSLTVINGARSDYRVRFVRVAPAKGDYTVPSIRRNRDHAVNDGLNSTYTAESGDDFEVSKGKHFSNWVELSVATEFGMQHNVTLQPAEIFVDGASAHVPYDGGSEALGVSNYVTNDTLPQNATFSQTCDDPENFRLQVGLADYSTATSVPATLKVYRDNTLISTHNYTVDALSSSLGRSEYIRLVTDSSDDAASGAGLSSDPEGQTVKVMLGDTIKASYEIATGDTIEQELTVGRPVAEDDNDPDSQRSHDIREVKLNLVIVRDGSGNPSITTTQANTAVADANERLAQAGIRAKIVGSIQTVNRPAALADGFTQSAGLVTTPTADEAALVALKDTDANTVDVFYVESLPARGIAYPAVRNSTGNAAYKNWVVLKSDTPGTYPHTLPHELMHILLDSPHRSSPADPSTAVFYASGTSANKDVTGTKRIGPYPGATTAGVGEDDTETIRENAETLP